MIYISTWDDVHRLDPESGDIELLVPSGAALAGGGTVDMSYKVIDFSPDFSRLYIGTLDESKKSGTLFVQNFDADMNLDGDLEVFATGVGTVMHDAIGVDACGNVYALENWTETLYRVSPSGEVTAMKKFDTSAHGFGHGIAWGSGIGEWKKHSIYLAMPYSLESVVLEVGIGVPSRDETRTR